MAEQEGNQELRVEEGSGASGGGGLDAGTDNEQTNRTPSSGVSREGGVDSHNDDSRNSGDRIGESGSSDAEKISKTGNANRGEVGSGTGESTGATKGFVTASRAGGDNGE